MKLKKQELDAVLEAVLHKISEKSVTCEDFNNLICKAVIGETTPESVRDRMRRRVKRTPTASHIDNETGHQQLELPTFADRIQPSIKPEHQQNHGRAKLGHAHSVRTQMQGMIEFINTNSSKPITEELVETINNKDRMRKLVAKLLIKPNCNRDWLYALLGHLDGTR